MYSTTKLRELNQYSAFTEQDVAQIIEFLQTGQFPPGMNQRQRNRFQEKFGQDFVVDDGRLYFNPNITIRLEVVPQEQQEAKLAELYGNTRRGLGIGINQFYQQVCMSYLGITMAEASTFLRKQGNYQITRPYTKQVNHPILSKTPNERWALDFIDMGFWRPGFNNGRKWILVVVDYFSGKVWARGLTNKDAQTTTIALADICADTNTYPHILQGDGEFGNAVLRGFCEQHGIDLLLTKSYTPASNGRVERMNREILKKIRDGMIYYNSFHWLNHLPEYLDNINGQVNSSTKYTPNQLWTAGYAPAQDNGAAIQPADNLTAAERRQLVSNRLVRRAEKLVGGLHPAKFRVGDRVRVALKNFQTEIRKRLKEGRGKTVVVRYSTKVLTVSQVLNGTPARREAYTLTENGEPIAENGQNKKFYANELVLVPPGSTAANIPNIARANQLNKVA